jgi:hypothetical protein
LYGTGGRTYDVTASATFADGSTTQVKNTLFVVDWSAVASCGGNVPFGASSTLTATLAPSSAPPQIQSYRWTIFDEPPATREGQSTTYTWQSKGTKTVRLTVQPVRGGPKESVCNLEVF